MQAIQDCINQIKKPGSSLYYSTLFLSEERMQVLSPLICFFWRIERIPRFTQETEVASSQLKWWYEELERAKKNQAQHPIAIALSQTQNEPENLMLLQQHIQHILKYQYDCQLDTIEDFVQFSQSRRLALVQLLLNYRQKKNKTSGEDNPQKIHTIFAELLSILDLLDGFHCDHKQGLIYFPLQSLIDHKLTVHQLCNLKNNRHEDVSQKSIKNRAYSFWYFWHQRALKLYQQLWQSDLKRQHDECLMLITYCSLRLKAINKSSKQGYNFHLNRALLTPLQKFWHTWRTKSRWMSVKKEPC